MYAVGTSVVSSRRWFCVGGLPVDIWAVINVEVYGRPTEGEICEVCVCVHVFIRPSKMEGSCCVRYGSSVQQFSDWDKTALSRGELGCLSHVSSCV